MRVVAYALRRLLLLLPVVFAALFLTFLMTRIVPGNPIDRVSGPFVTDERRAELKHEAYLDRPFYTQFALYLRDLAHGSMGTSYTTAQDVSKDLRQRLPATFELVTYTMLVAIAIGVPLGILGAVRQNSAIDQTSRIVAVMGVSIPVFWIGLVLLYVFFYKFGWLPGPVGRTGSIEGTTTRTGLITLEATVEGDWHLLEQAFRALVLPVAALTLGIMAPIARLTRGTMIEILESDYIRTARSLGLSSRVVIVNHGLRNALVPIITIIAVIYGYALGGVVLVEIIFSWPGLGNYSYTAIQNSDFPALQGFVLLVTVIYVLIYLALDIIAALLDPRVKY
jgi:peptide/nickel transport system permease protein